jgi:probable HAF family extracellular repeat protein
MKLPHQTFLVLFLSLAGISSAWSASFQGLGFLSGRPIEVSCCSAGGVSGDGSTVVGSGVSETGGWALRWSLSNSEPQIIAGHPGQGLGEGWGEARGASHDGSIAVGEDGNKFPEFFPPREAWRWTSETGRVGLGGTDSGAWDISGDGNVVVGVSTFPSGRQAFRWTNATGMVELGDLVGGDVLSHATGISDEGNVIVGYGMSTNGQEAFRWTSESGMVGLGDLEGGNFGSIANDISADGIIIIGQGNSENGPEAFRWTAEEGMVGLGDLPGGLFSSEAIATSADGRVIVG